MNRMHRMQCNKVFENNERMKKNNDKKLDAFKLLYFSKYFKLQ